MIRQELMDNVEQLLNVLNGALNLDNPPSIRLGCVEEAYKLGTSIAEIVTNELEEQRQEMSDVNMMAVDEFGLPIQESDFDQFKEYCKANNLKPSNGKVLNEYFKGRGV